MDRSTYVSDVLARFERTYPVDMHAMASELGIRVKEQPFPDSISGKIERDWTDRYVITVNAGHSRTRKRFTIAHEIAHFILHRDLIGDGIVDNAMYRDNRIGDVRERQANRYAASLLMPESLVRKAWRDGIRNSASFAAAFEVSQAVADIRWSELGCRFWAYDHQDELPF